MYSNTTTELCFPIKICIDVYIHSDLEIDVLLLRYLNMIAIED